MAPNFPNIWDLKFCLCPLQILGPFVPFISGCRFGLWKPKKLWGERRARSGVLIQSHLFFRCEVYKEDGWSFNLRFINNLLTHRNWKMQGLLWIWGSPKCNQMPFQQAAGACHMSRGKARTVSEQFDDCSVFCAQNIFMSKWHFSGSFSLPVSYWGAVNLFSCRFLFIFIA